MRRVRQQWGGIFGIILAVAISAVVVACSAETGDGAGSESHFVSCDVDADCASLGDHFACREGQCRNTGQTAAALTTCNSLFGNGDPGPPYAVCTYEWGNCDDGHSYELRCDGVACFCFRDDEQVAPSFASDGCPTDPDTLSTYCQFRIDQSGASSGSPASLIGTDQIFRVDIAGVSVRDIALADDGSAYVTGAYRAGSAGAASGFLAAVAPEGDVVWETRLDGGIGRAVAAGSPDDLYVVGSTEEATAGWLARYGRDGTLVWRRSLEGRADALALGLDRALVVAGKIAESSGITSAWVSERTPDGDAVWSHIHPDEPMAPSAARAVAVDDDGSVAVAGYQGRGTETDESVSWVRLLSDGDVVDWDVTFDDFGAGHHSASGVGFGPDGGVIVRGHREQDVSDAVAWRTWLRFLGRADGAEESIFTDAIDDGGFAVAPDGRMAIGGGYIGGDGQPILYVGSRAPDGGVSWTERVGGCGRAIAVDIAADGTVAAAGDCGDGIGVFEYHPR